MTYSTIALIALLVHCIVNYNALRNRHYRNTTPAGKMYRWLMVSVAAFHAFDTIWGMFYDAHLIPLVFADTVFYFAAMTTTVFLWCRYVVKYLQTKNWLTKVLDYVGWIYLFFVAGVLLLNFIKPVMFWFDENGEYHAENLRYVLLVMQVLMFLISACYVLYTGRNKKRQVKRHHMAIGIFGIAMTLMVILQIAYPLLPFYSIGCLLGTCILHTFVLEDLKEDRRLELEEMVRREEKHKQELGSARKLAYKDSLTGVNSKHAYIKWEGKINEKIRRGG